MRLKDLLLVGVPEVVLVLGIILAIYDLNMLKEMKYKKKESIVKMAVSIVMVLIVNVVSRMYFHNFLSIAGCTTLIYTIVLGFVWKLNSSIVFGGLAFIVLAGSEILTYPILNMMIDNEIANPMIISDRFILTMPSRIFQLIIFIACIKLNIILKHSQIFNQKFIKLSIQKKINVALIIVLNILTSIFIGNYGERFAKLRFQDLKAAIITNNTQIFYVTAIIFIFVAVIIIRRTIKNEAYKQITNSPQKSFQTIIQSSKKEEIEYYARLLASYLNVLDFEDIEQIFEKLSTKITYVEYNIGKEISLTVFDYRHLLNLFEYLIGILSTEVEATSFILNIKEIKDSISINIEIEFNDFQKIKFKKYIMKDKTFNELKANLKEDNATFNINFDSSIVDLAIEIPVKEVIFNEG